MPNTTHFDHPPRPHNQTLRAMYSEYRQAMRSTPWHCREQDKYPLHYSIQKLLDKGVTARDWEQLLLEWPHVSVNDTARVAYTRNEAHGEADRQTVTSLGKYLRRHFSIPDHEIRDVCAQASGGMVHITRDMGTMIWAVQTGPGSCMQSSQWDEDDHPYNVYDPQYGWALAYREEEDDCGVMRCTARALLYEGDPEGDAGAGGCFVRSYKGGGSYSHSDECIESTLKDMGYRRVNYWPDGARLKRIEAYDSIVLPYIDGGSQTVADHGAYLTIDDDGDYIGSQTNGLAEGGSTGEPCDSCGDMTDEDELVAVGNPNGYHFGDTRVCEHCADNRYTHVTGQGGETYYLHYDYVVNTVDGKEYDEDYLSDNNIVELADGEYAPIDDTVQVPDGDYYIVDDVGHGVVELHVPYTDNYNDEYNYACEEDTIQTRGGKYFYSDKSYEYDIDDIDELHYFEATDEWVHDDELTDNERVDLGMPVCLIDAGGQLKLHIHKDYVDLLALPAPSVATSAAPNITNVQ